MSEGTEEENARRQLARRVRAARSKGAVTAEEKKARQREGAARRMRELRARAAAAKADGEDRGRRRNYRLEANHGELVDALVEAGALAANADRDVVDPLLTKIVAALVACLPPASANFSILVDWVRAVAEAPVTRNGYDLSRVVELTERITEVWKKRIR